MMYHHCATQNHTEVESPTLKCCALSLQFFTWCTTTTNTVGAFDPTFLGYPSWPWFKYEILCCKGFYIYVQPGCVSPATVWRRPGRGQTAPISLSPRAFVVCPQVLPSPPIYYNCYCYSVPLQSTLYFLAAGH